MKIVAIETFPVRIPLKPERRMVSAAGYHGVSDYLLVRLVTDTRYRQVGEATVTPCWSGETVWRRGADPRRTSTGAGGL